MTQLKEMAGPLQADQYLPGQATAGTDSTWSVWVPQFNGVLTGVLYVPNAAITADGTNNSVLTLTNKAAGAGSTAMASRSWAATNSVASTPEAFTLNGTPANLLFSAGDNIAIVKTHGGTGLVLPDARLVLKYTRR